MTGFELAWWSVAVCVLALLVAAFVAYDKAQADAAEDLRRWRQEEERRNQHIDEWFRHIPQR